MSIAEEIISYCKENRISTTEVSDAIGKKGVAFMARPVTNGLYKVGRIKCIFAANNSNWDVHDQIRSATKGDVIVIFAHNCDKERAIIGDLVSKYALLYLGAAAIVIQGAIRDAAAVKREGYAVWSQAISPLGCHNNRSSPFPDDEKYRLLDMYEGGIAVCDDGGVTLIENSNLNKETLERLRLIEMQEDIWFYCLDVLKWDTKKIVCDKAYLNLESVDEFPRAFTEKLRRLHPPGGIS
jgi:4-hydroxy-4-methyl-2-oxoglutarate aldolase